ncbi:hypothetical protein [Pseudoalteromonas sp. S16_S37]|uniref:hypothetical protein n=1 Tax=Pseudoalteromonas sp. S16_S37 TaxID=2720228 RepID=UPI0016813578|nr:hypothetical protein [Pseudoalteromonas sp. S16_S37]MBD1582870.1 hypothetical protein [Pseudoalteromonas sp. S16_S37]
MRKILLASLVLFTAPSLASEDLLPDANCKVSFENIPKPCFDGAISAGSSANTQGFRNYSTKQFYALNWPVEKLGGQSPNTKAVPSAFDITVWQTWKTKSELTYDKKPSITAKTQASIKSLILNTGSDLPNNFKQHIEYLSDTTIPDQEGISLITSDNKNVYFQVYYNDVAVADLHSFSSNKDKFSTGSSSPQKRGAIVVKAAWRVITNLPKQKRDTYHSSIACVYNENSNCSIELVGLIGLHIANKMNPEKNSSEANCNTEKCLNKSISAWSWSTYEYMYNAPSLVSESDFIKAYQEEDWALFNKPITDDKVKACFTEGKVALSNTECAINEATTSVPANIVRFFPADRSVPLENLNKETCSSNSLTELDYSSCLPILGYASLKSQTPLINYRFVENVWVDSLGNILPAYSAQTPVETIIRNTSMEPFDRTLSIDNKNCIACHREAQFDGIFTVPQVLKGENK